MALHGVSSNLSQSKLENVRRVIPTSFARGANRRAVEGSASAASDAEDAQASRVDQSPRRLARSIPNSSAVICALDLFFIGLAQATVFGIIHARLEFAGATQVPMVVALSVVANIAFLYAFGSYRRETLVNRNVAAARLPVALGFAALVFFAALHYGFASLYPLEHVYQSISRCVTIALVGAGISLCGAVVSRITFYAMAHRQWFRRRILVLGTGQRALYLRNLMNHDAHRMVSDLYFVSESCLGAPPPKVEDGLRDATLATNDMSIDELARTLMIDEVVIAVDERRGISLERLLTCKTSGIPVTGFQTFVERETGHVDLSWLELSWLVYSDGFRMRPIDVLMKRFLDISVSFILLFVSFPVLLGATIAIWLSGQKPFFQQERVTRDGRRFSLYKLRTMRADAEKNGPQWALVNDARITRVGALLRRTRIDEIPQLINVLRGDMSLVGPRPERPVFVSQLSEEIRMYDLRHTVKSGLTGWAQINYPYGASKIDAERKLEYDLYYIKNYSLLRDISILVQTIRVVFWPQGVR